jgi:hypothetical protein
MLALLAILANTSSRIRQLWLKLLLGPGYVKKLPRIQKGASGWVWSENEGWVERR